MVQYKVTSFYSAKNERNFPHSVKKYWHGNRKFKSLKFNAFLTNKHEFKNLTLFNGLLSTDIFWLFFFNVCDKNQIKNSNDFVEFLKKNG